jgi:hypothetical protein
MGNSVLDMNDLHATQLGHRLDETNVLLVLNERVKKLGRSFLG